MALFPNKTHEFSGHYRQVDVLQRLDSAFPGEKPFTDMLELKLSRMCWHTNYPLMRDAQEAESSRRMAQILWCGDEL